MQDGRSIQDGSLNRAALAAIVKKDGRSIRQLATDSDVSAGYLAKILRGEKLPKLATAMRIAAALDVALSSFYAVNPALSSQIDVLESGAVRAS